jgi:hypothetical protein
MQTILCIAVWRWPGQIIRILVIIVIAAAVARLDPAAAIPLIAGLGLGGWLLASAPALGVAQ